MARAPLATTGWLAIGSAICLGLLLAGASLDRAGAHRTAPPIEQATPDSPASPGALAPTKARQRHLNRLGADLWHARGWQGAGVKVAILDTGFRGYRAFLGKGLPAAVRCRSFRADRDLEARDSQHGILCAEVIHAVAPRAELLLANWESDHPESFLDAVRWARAEGARVVSCSVIMPSWSDGEGGGAVHRALQRILGRGDDPGDLLCCASAGNTAQRHWSGAFRPDRDGCHQWAPGRTRNELVPWGHDRVAVELYGCTRTPYELCVLDEGGTEVGTARLRTDATGRCGRAVVRFDPEPGMSYRVRLHGPAGGRPPVRETLHVVALGGQLEINGAGGSIPFPGDGARVLAVGAVDGQGRRASYSSCGPNSTRPKPDLVAPVPFPSLCRTRPFAGTSAAAPQAAALAALIWSRHPDWNADAVRTALRRAADDLGPPGHDCETGYGRIRLP